MYVSNFAFIMWNFRAAVGRGQKDGLAESFKMVITPRNQVHNFSEVERC